MTKPVRRSVDLSGYPDLVVIYLGYRARSLRGLRSLLRIGVGLRALRRAPPEGLLVHEDMLFGPLHVGFRQYWRDLERLEAFTRAQRHAGWWGAFGRDAGGGGFWHETYRLRGGMEAIYLDMKPIGLGGFAPALAPDGAFLTARQRIGVAVTRPERSPA